MLRCEKSVIQASSVFKMAKKGDRERNAGLAGRWVHGIDENTRRWNVLGGGYGILGLAWIQGGGSVLAGGMVVLGDDYIQDEGYTLAGA